MARKTLRHIVKWDEAASAEVNPGFRLLVAPLREFWGKSKIVFEEIEGKNEKCAGPEFLT